MSLQRLKKLVREHNWFAVVLEILIVILGITLAFQINLWNENRKERLSEQHILNGLIVEFKLAEQEINSDMSNRQKYLDNVELIKNCRTGNLEIPEDSVRIVIDRLLNFRFYTPTHPILEELKSSGKFDIIKSEEIRMLITHYLQEKDRLAVLEEAERKMVSDIVEPYFKKHLDLTNIFSDSPTAYSRECKRFKERIRDPEFGSLLYFRMKRTRGALQYSDRVLVIIKDLQGSLPKYIE